MWRSRCVGTYKMHKADLRSCRRHGRACEMVSRFWQDMHIAVLYDVLADCPICESMLHVAMVYLCRLVSTCLRLRSQYFCHSICQAARAVRYAATSEQTSTTSHADDAPLQTRHTSAHDTCFVCTTPVHDRLKDSDSVNDTEKGRSRVHSRQRGSLIAFTEQSEVPVF